MNTKLVLVTALAVALFLAGCASSGYGRPRVSYSMGFGSYYGPSPWHRYPGCPVYIGDGGGIPDIPDGPVAEPLPDFGMPDMGPEASFDDFGDFDF